jgi:hypothetical protein
MLSSFTPFIQAIQLKVLTVEPKYDVTTNLPPEVLIWCNNQLHNENNVINHMM